MTYCVRHAELKENVTEAECITENDTFHLSLQRLNICREEYFTMFEAANQDIFYPTFDELSGKFVSGFKWATHELYTYRHQQRMLKNVEVSLLNDQGSSQRHRWAYWKWHGIPRPESDTTGVQPPG